MSHLILGFASPVTAEGAVLARFTPGLGLFQSFLSAPTDSGPDAIGLTALARSDRYLFAAHRALSHRGEDEPGLLVYRREDFLFEGRYLLTGLADVRGLFWWDETLYASSNGTGEVVAFRTTGPRVHADRFVWKSPSEIELLGPLALHGADLFVSARQRIWNITRGVPAWTVNGDRAHLLSTGGDLHAADAPGVLHNLSRGLTAPLTGPASGLARLEGQFYTAVADPFRGISLARSPELDAREVLPLPVGPVLPSDLIAIEEAGGWPEEVDSSWANSHGRPL